MMRDYKINNEQLIMKTALPFQTLEKMEIRHDINAHMSLKMRVIANEEEHEEILSRDWSDTNLTVLRKGEEGLPLFVGSIERLVCHKENQLLIMEVSGVGETMKLDRKKKRQSFQNIGMTYKQVAQKVMEGYQEVNFIWNVSEDKEIGAPLIQYDETDWEFLIRLSSHFHETVIADWQSGKPMFHFGMYAGKERYGQDMEILGSGFGDIYYHNGCYENGMPRNQNLYLMIKSKENWQMGDFLFYEGRNHQVYSKKILFENGELFFIYQLGMRGMFYSKTIYNNALTGARIEGVIRKTEEESVYMQLDIDEEERADFLWDWAPETNNLSYCMPEAGTKAVLYLPTREEKDGRVVLATVHNMNSAKYTDVQKREFATAHHKKVGLYPDRLFVEGTDGNVSVSLEDGQGNRIKSHAGISLLADGEVLLSGRNIKATSPTELVCKTGQSNIELCRDINLFAPGGVKTVGTGVTAKRAKEPDKGNATGKQEIEYWQTAFSAVAAIPDADLGKIGGQDSMVELFACGGIPKVAGGASVVALSEVMDGRKESECSFPNVFKSMNNYTVKGAYALPSEES